MEQQFSRTELLLGKQGIEKLSNAHIAVFGIGGVGGHAVDALVRSGIGAVDIIDADKFTISNINRQIYATHSTVGRYKVEVAKERIYDINPNCEVKTHCTFVTADNITQFDFSKYDYVIDAVDTVSAKLAITEECHKAGTPIISSMGAGNKLDATAFEVADIYDTSVCPLARVMRSELRKRKIPSLKVVYSKEKPIKPDYTDCDEKGVPGSTAFVPATVGLIISGEVIKDIAM